MHIIHKKRIIFCSIWIAKYSARVTPFRSFRRSPKRGSLFTKIKPKRFRSTHWCMASFWILMVLSLKLGTLKLLYGLLGIYWIVSIGLGLDYISSSSRRAVRRLTVIVQKSYRKNICIDCAITCFAAYCLPLYMIADLRRFLQLKFKTFVGQMCIKPNFQNCSVLSKISLIFDFSDLE